MKGNAKWNSKTKYKQNQEDSFGLISKNQNLHAKLTQKFYLLFWTKSNGRLPYLGQNVWKAVCNEAVNQIWTESER